MPWPLQFLVTIGEWMQAHQVFVLACSGTVVVVLGLAHLSARAYRRPWR